MLYILHCHHIEHRLVASCWQIRTFCNISKRQQLGPESPILATGVTLIAYEYKEKRDVLCLQAELRQRGLLERRCANLWRILRQEYSSKLKASNKSRTNWILRHHGCWGILTVSGGVSTVDTFRLRITSGSPRSGLNTTPTMRHLSTCILTIS